MMKINFTHPVMECRICKEEICNVALLPCKHKYCLICVKRHLNIKNFCPECYMSPLHDSDISTQSICTTSPIFKYTKFNSLYKYIKVQNSGNKLPKSRSIMYAKMTVEQLKKECKRFKINSGSKKEMTIRLKEFYMICDVERTTDTPANVEMIANYVNSVTYKKKPVSIESIVMKHINEIVSVKRKFLKKIKKLQV